MKKTLLVLALLVTGELGIEMAETCPIFYGIFGVLAIGNKFLLDASLELVSATQPEKVALGKIQDCYNEAGIESKILDVIALGSITTSKDCILYAVDLKK